MVTLETDVGSAQIPHERVRLEGYKRKEGVVDASALLLDSETASHRERSRSRSDLLSVNTGTGLGTLQTSLCPQHCDFGVWVPGSGNGDS